MISDDLETNIKRIFVPSAERQPSEYFIQSGSLTLNQAAIVPLMPATRIGEGVSGVVIHVELLVIITLWSIGAPLMAMHPSCICSRQNTHKKGKQ